MNTQLHQNLDVTGDGKPDTITLFLKAANVRAPVQWTLTIDSAGQTVFEHDGEDSEVDALFDDREQMPGCPDYVTCKEQYYFHSILDNLVNTDWDPEDFLDAAGHLPAAVPRYLVQCCSLMGPPADKVMTDVETRLRARKAIVIAVPVTPVMMGPRMVYSPDAMQFVEIEAE